MKDEFIFIMEEKYQEYLRDESRLEGWANSISFPKNEQEILKIIEQAEKTNQGITIQGGRTGIVGGAVPMGGHIMNMSFMKGCGKLEEMEDGTARIFVEAGITLMELEQQILKQGNGRFFWPPSPTENSATVGGVLSTLAKGINVWHYKDCCNYVNQIRLLCSDKSVRTFERGQRLFDREESNGLSSILGGEGNYGVITAAELILHLRPEQVWGIAFFFRDIDSAGKFVSKLKDQKDGTDSYLLAGEYMDRKTMDMVESRKKNVSAIRELPDVPAEFSQMIYLELAGTEEGILALAEECMENASLCGADDDFTWAVTGEMEMKRIRAFRHAAAESANIFIEEQRHRLPSLTKLGSDISFGQMSLKEAVSMYQEDMEEQKLKGCIFGHIKGMHLHVNLLPVTEEENQRGKLLMRQWARKAEALGGSAVTEHGFGKLKEDLRRQVLSKEQMNEQQQLKAALDPAGIWNRKADKERRE